MIWPGKPASSDQRLGLLRQPPRIRRRKSQSEFFTSRRWGLTRHAHAPSPTRSEEHTSELQSRLHLVCRLLLEKKKTRLERSSHAATIKWHGYNMQLRR